MRYYYTDTQNQAAGPLEEEALYRALHEGSLNWETMVTGEGSEDWQPLASILPYYFSFGAETLGPMPLAKVRILAQSSEDPVMVSEPGSSEWRDLADLLPAPVPAVAVQGTPPGTDNPYAPPQSVHPSAGVQERRPSFPWGVRVAGIIWILFGADKLLGVVMVLIELSRLPDGMDRIGWFAILFPLAVGLIFLAIGIQTCTGSPPDTRSNGIGSIGIGIVFIPLLWAMSGLRGETDRVELLAAAFGIGALILAGFLALSHRKSYLRWKQWRGGGRVVRPNVRVRPR